MHVYEDLYYMVAVLCGQVQKAQVNLGTSLAFRFLLVVVLKTFQSSAVLKWEALCPSEVHFYVRIIGRIASS